MDKLTSEKPVVTILTVVAASVAIIVGGIVTITNPQTLSFHQYVQDIAFMAGALGLGSGIGRGIDSYGQAVAQTRPPVPAPAPIPAAPLPPPPPPDPLSQPGLTDPPLDDR